eukprot:s2967_g5.t1
MTGCEERQVSARAPSRQTQDRVHFFRRPMTSPSMQSLQPASKVSVGAPAIARMEKRKVTAVQNPAP